MKNLLLITLAVGLVIGTYYWEKPPAPRPPRMAGEGIYYLKDYFSMTTPTGIVGWTPGQEVRVAKLESEKNGALTVTDGTYSAIVPGEMLTQDMDAADAILLADQGAQAQAHSNADVLSAMNAKSEYDAKVATAGSIQRTNDQQAASSTIGTYNSRLHEPTRFAGSGSYTTTYVYPTYVASGNVPVAANGAAASSHIQAPAAPVSASRISSVAGSSGSRAIPKGPNFNAPNAQPSPVGIIVGR